MRLTTRLLLSFCIVTVFTAVSDRRVVFMFIPSIIFLYLAENKEKVLVEQISTLGSRLEVKEVGFGKRVKQFIDNTSLMNVTLGLVFLSFVILWFVEKNMVLNSIFLGLITASVMGVSLVRFIGISERYNNRIIQKYTSLGYEKSILALKDSIMKKMLFEDSKLKLNTDIFLEMSLYYMLFNMQLEDKSLLGLLKVCSLFNRSDSSNETKLDLLFKKWEMKNPNHIGIEKYHKFQTFGEHEKEVACESARVIINHFFNELTKKENYIAYYTFVNENELQHYHKSFLKHKEEYGV